MTIPLEFAGSRIGVVGLRAADGQWLSEFLSPAFRNRACSGVVQSLDESQAAGYTATVRVHRMEPAELESRLLGFRSKKVREVDVFLADGQFRSLPGCRTDTGSELYDESAHTLMRIDLASKQVELFQAEVTGDSRLIQRRLVMRVVRELAMSCLSTPDRVLLHGAAYRVNGQGILLCGPKGSGKSTSLVSALASRATLVSNDRVVVELPSASMQCVPTIVRLRRGLVEHHPEVARRLRNKPRHSTLSMAEAKANPRRTMKLLDRLPESHMASLSLAQLANTLQCSSIGTTALTTVAFLNLRQTRAGSQLHALSPEETAEQLYKNILRPGLRFQLSSQLTISEASAAVCWPTEFELASACRKLADQITGIRLELGRDAHQVPWTNGLPQGSENSGRLWSA